MLFVCRLVLLSPCSGYCGEKSLEIAWDCCQRDGDAQSTVQDDLQVLRESRLERKWLKLHSKCVSGLK